MLTSKNQSYTFLNTIENLLKQKLRIKFINSNGELVGINNQSHRFEIFNWTDVNLIDYICLIKINKADAHKCGNPQLLKNLYFNELSHVNNVILQAAPSEISLLDLMKFHWLSLDDVEKTLGDKIYDKRYLTIQNETLQVKIQTMTKEVKQLHKQVNNLDILTNIVLGHK